MNVVLHLQRIETAILESQSLSRALALSYKIFEYVQQQPAPEKGVRELIPIPYLDESAVHHALQLYRCLNAGDRTGAREATARLRASIVIPGKLGDSASAPH